MKESETIPVHFAKMHGAGNDYVYILALKDMLSEAERRLIESPEELAELARRISDRHFGVGGDGLVLVCPSATADFRMRMFNADGSEAQMCGNAIRCVAKLLFDKGLHPSRTLSIETLAGKRILELETDGGEMTAARVDMGEPILERKLVPVASEGEGPMVSETVCLDGEEFPMTAVSMGNPHGVVFVPEITDRLVLETGKRLEVHPIWPEKANIEFASVKDRGNIEMRVWERGSGETLACGTGSCATAVAAVLNGLADRKVILHLRGGDLRIEWNEEDNHVYMTGPATLVAEGTYLYRK